MDELREPKHDKFYAVCDPNGLTIVSTIDCSEGAAIKHFMKSYEEEELTWEELQAKGYFTVYDGWEPRRVHDPTPPAEAREESK